MSVRPIHFIFSCLILLGIQELCYAQEYLFREFTPVDGLSHSTVFCSYQDNEGYLWFGTYETVHRYDGREFQEPLKTHPIATNRIRRITQDSLGRMWISSRDGAICLEKNGARILKEADGLSHHSVSDIHEDSQGNLWFATEQGLSRMDPQQRWRIFTTTDGLPHPNVRRILPKADGTMWLATLGGLAFFDGTYIQPIELDPQFQPLAIYAMSMDAQERLWLGTTQGLFCLSDVGLRRFSLDQGLPSDNIWALLVDDQQQLWIGSDAGLCSAPVDGLLQGQARIKRVSEKHYLAFTTIYSIDQDREGTLWFGTCIGLFQLNTPSLKQYDFSDHSVGDMVLSVAETGPGTIWIGTDRGVLRMQDDHVENVTDMLDLPDTFIRCILPLPDGSLWFGTRDGAALRGGPKPITLNKASGLPDHIIFSMYQDADGALFLGTQDSGLIRWQAGQTQTWGLEEGLSGLRVHCIYPHPQEGLLLGTDGGLDWFRQGDITRLRLPVPSAEVYDILTDDKGTTWLGTHVGVIALNQTQAILYDKTHGLPDNRCRQIALDEQQRLWIGTSRGLSMLKNGRFTSFHPPPPKSPFEMNHGAALTSKHGQLWFGHYRGALQCRPENYQVPNISLPIFLTEVRVLDQTQPQTSMLDLSYDQNEITFAYQGLHYPDPERIKYRYRLAGYNADWRETDQTSISFRDLKPGEFQFEVHAGDPNGQWSREPSTLAFEIHPPFWTQWWFRLGSFMVLAAFVAWQFQQLRLRNRLLTEKADSLSSEVAREKAAKLLREAEVKLLHSQMNPHFLQNAFTNAIYLVKAEPQKAETMLHQLSQLFRRTMQAKRQIWASVGEEVSLIEDYLAIQKVRFGKRITAEIHCPDQLKAFQIPAFILQPLVENACIHGQKENLGPLHITIHCENRDQEIWLQVTNNGQPFDNLKGPPIQPGHALDNINKRLELLNQKPLIYEYQNGNHQFSIVVEFEHENATG